MELGKEKSPTGKGEHNNKSRWGVKKKTQDPLGDPVFCICVQMKMLQCSTQRERWVMTTFQMEFGNLKLIAQNSLPIIPIFTFRQPPTPLPHRSLR